MKGTCKEFVRNTPSFPLDKRNLSHGKRSILRKAKDGVSGAGRTGGGGSAGRTGSRTAEITDRTLCRMRNGRGTRCLPDGLRKDSDPRARAYEGFLAALGMTASSPNGQ